VGYFAPRAGPSGFRVAVTVTCHTKRNFLQQTRARRPSLTRLPPIPLSLSMKHFALTVVCPKSSGRRHGRKPCTPKSFEHPCFRRGLARLSLSLCRGRRNSSSFGKTKGVVNGRSVLAEKERPQYSPGHSASTFDPPLEASSSLPAPKPRPASGGLRAFIERPIAHLPPCGQWRGRSGAAVVHFVTQQSPCGSCCWYSSAPAPGLVPPRKRTSSSRS
jgi:hypothetical protein